MVPKIKTQSFSQSNHYILFGHPVSHSLSPQIHQNFASQFNIPINYQTQDCECDQFPQALQHFREQGGKGANITLPLKELAYTLCQKTTPAAALAQAVNTLYWDESNILWGDNTDGIGLVRDLKNNYHQVLSHKNILVLGAGGAAAGILPSLLSENPKQIYLANRNYNRAVKLANKINHPKLSVLPFDQLSGPLPHQFDIIINATSASLTNQLPPLDASIINNQFVYDLAYDLKKPTVFVQWARDQGAKEAHDGLGMLIEQAAESFYIWHHKRPNTDITVEAHE